MILVRRRYAAWLLALAIGLASGWTAQAEQPEQPDRFTFTPKFKDPIQGTRRWERSGDEYTETLPGGRVNTFKVVKRDKTGTIVHKISDPNDPNFYVHIPNVLPSQKSGQKLFWSRTNSWSFMGVMDDVVAPQRID